MSIIFKFLRLNAPAGFLLPFFSACFGQFLASPFLPDFSLTLLFFIGSVITRSAGCVINDIFDRNFDAHVARTRNRPLANNTIDLKTAIILLLILSICSLAILLLLSRTAIIIGFIAAFMIATYPLMKRITYMPQVFLGFTFNYGTLIAYASVVDKIDFPVIMMYTATCCWTIGYDTIYAFMDLTDDKKIGVKSMAILLENKNYKAWLYAFYAVFIILFMVANFTLSHPLNYLLLILAGLLLLWQVFTLNITNTSNCLKRFKANNYVGAFLALAMLT